MGGRGEKCGGGGGGGGGVTAIYNREHTAMTTTHTPV